MGIDGLVSRVFDGTVGKTVAAGTFSPRDYLIDPARFDSEGNWAFCRFDGSKVTAARMGFQRGGFNGGIEPAAVDRGNLQLHLELMLENGAVLWLPTGKYPAGEVTTNADKMDIRLARGGTEIFHMHGWPHMECHFRSEEGDAEAWLEFDFETVTVLPDCVLPQSVFAMWEAMGAVRGRVRYLNETTEVKGKVFFDHPRVVHGPNAVVPRKMYIYTPLYFDDGSYLIGYHAEGVDGRKMDYYCFGVYVDRRGRGRFLKGETTGIVMDRDEIPERWRVAWEDGDVRVEAEIVVKRDEILRSWGGEKMPVSRREYVIMALVLEGKGRIVEGGRERAVTGKGLAEFYDTALWPAK